MKFFYWKSQRKLWEPSGSRGVRQSNSFHGVAFDWKHLKFWNSKEYQEIKEFLDKRRSLSYMIFPGYHTNSFNNWAKIFRSLVLTPYKDTKIVIIGQDPYYTKGLADGLAFSVPPNISKIPGSLSNIIKEYCSDLGYPKPRTGDLSHWANNGVLLLNAVWTVEEGSPKSHYKINGKQLWQELTAEIIQSLNRKDKLVFILWGKVAQEWRYLIDEKKHLVLIGAHPSPRNFTWTGKGPKFAGGKYFSKACDYLKLDKRIWKLP